MHIDDILIRYTAYQKTGTREPSRTLKKPDPGSQWDLSGTYKNWKTKTLVGPSRDPIKTGTQDPTKTRNSRHGTLMRPQQDPRKTRKLGPGILVGSQKDLRKSGKPGPETLKKLENQDPSWTLRKPEKRDLGL